MISTRQLKTANNHGVDQAKKVLSSFLAPYFYGASMIVALASTAVLITSCANAQVAQTGATAVPAIEGALAPIPTQPRTEPQTALQDPVKPEPKYNSKDIARAFKFIDANHDGKISREEASGFRNIAKYFDAADTDKNNMLSLEEFANALNRP